MEEKRSKMIVLVAVVSLVVVALLLGHLGWIYTRLGQVIMAVLFAANAIAFANLQRFEKGFARVFSLFTSVFMGASSLVALTRAVWPF